MKYRELIRHSHKILAGKLKLDWLSRFYGSPVYSRKKSQISEDEIRDLQDQLLAVGIFSHLQASNRKYHLKVLRGQPGRPRRRYFIHVILFLLTILTTTLTGAMLRGVISFESLHDLTYGLPYSFALMSILLTHEMGHYLASRYYKVDVTLPYFIPLFLPQLHPGTLGAFIKMRSPIPNKQALFDIGVAGPLAGFVMSVTFLILGFSRLPDALGIQSYIGQIHPLNGGDGLNLTLGNSLLYNWLADLFDGHRLPMNEMYHFPFIFAGWLGLLVTAINLMPIGQLDGGHITYAMFGDRSRYVAIAAFIALILLNIYLITNFNSFVWLLWPILILIFIRFRHPPTLQDNVTLGPKRKALAWLSYIIFLICIVPMPFYIS